LVKNKDIVWKFWGKLRKSKEDKEEKMKKKTEAKKKTLIVHRQSSLRKKKTENYGKKEKTVQGKISTLRKSNFRKSVTQDNIFLQLNELKNTEETDGLNSARSDNEENPLRDCDLSNGFKRLKKRYQGLRLKNKILLTQEREQKKMRKERAQEIKKYFGAKASRKLMQGNLTKQEKLKRKLIKNRTAVPEIFATEYLSKRKLKELRAKNK
jgi:hypothetical protein